MAARLAYVIVYVPEVPKSVQFYEKAFNLKLRYIDNSRKWAEFDTGSTTLAFTPEDQREVKLRGGTTPSPSPPQNVEIAFNVDDVHASFKHAVEHGATPVASPESKPWGQVSGFLRDPDGIVIRLGSHVNESKMK